MGTNSEYLNLVSGLGAYREIPTYMISSLWGYANTIYRSDQQNRYSEPMPWVGMYIALASLVCILAMVADLLHGLRNKKLWFPCKYFTLNAASFSVIAVAIKLPMDLNNSMPGNADLAAKLGSMAFMCTIMANTLPSLTNMDIKELLTNIIVLGVQVITLVVNICIQLELGVISYFTDLQFTPNNREAEMSYEYIPFNRSIAIIYVAILLVLLIIHTCSALMILRSKQILESKYQATHEIALKDLELQQPGRLNVEKLKQHVSNYWIMAGTSSPQFVTACSATTSAFWCNMCFKHYLTH